jgi:hypothetical protein
LLHKFRLHYRINESVPVGITFDKTVVDIALGLLDIGAIGHQPERISRSNISRRGYFETNEINNPHPGNHTSEKTRRLTPSAAASWMNPTAL